MTWMRGTLMPQRALMVHIEARLNEILRVIYRTEGKLDSLSSRVDRVEDREHKRQDNSDEFSSKEVLMQMVPAGQLVLAILVLILSGLGLTVPAEIKSLISGGGH